jgi:ComF family protein
VILRVLWWFSLASWPTTEISLRLLTASRHRYTDADASGRSLHKRSSGRGRFVFSSNGDPARAAATTSGLIEKPPVAWLSGVAQSLFATLFPSECRLCDAFLTNISRLPVCEECISAMQPMAGSFCARCGERLVSRRSELPDGASGVLAGPDGRDARLSIEDDADGICGVCRIAPPPYSVASAYGSYDTGLRELIHLLKYDSVRPAANVLGSMLAQVIVRMQPAFRAEDILVVPVPLHSAKLRQRGFNQAELIARAAVKRGARLELSPHLLERRRVTQSQIGLTQNQRKENLRGAFRVAKRDNVEGREVLLVDDVFTTGTTVSECARVLLRAGASKVWIATVARTLKTNVRAAEDFETLPVAMAG